MIDIKELEKERNKAYDVWFERWWARADLEQQINISNAKGYTGYVIGLDNYNKYEKRRMTNDRFLMKLEEKLPGFRFGFKYSVMFLTNKEYISGVSISWK